MKAQTATVYFDGLCLVCSTEINHYKKLPGSESLEFVDITAADFSAQRHGLDPHKVHKVMHVRDKEGNLLEGVSAFRAIWSEIPRYRLLHRASEKKIIRSLLESGYNAFVWIRPYLPRKKSSCAASPYCEVNK